jgi:ATP-dependent RNA helicase RhlE
MTFDNLNLITPIKDALITEGYTKPTPIQQEAIPIILEGKDLLGCAQTGTGKTAAFAIPIIQQLYLRLEASQSKGKPEIKALIVTPTRELAIQIGESFSAYGRNAGLFHTVIFGGVTQHSQTEALRKGVDILIATPGRLLDLMKQGYIKLSSIELFVLDEADRMLDMGFIHDVKKLIAALPQKRQSLFFSATMPPEIVKLAHTILNNPVKVEVTPISSTVEIIEQYLYYVDRDYKSALLKHILEDQKLISILVFTRTKHGADKLAKYLSKANIPADAIHGNKSQNARQRALSDFKERKIRVLVASDIAARGIDIDELSCVVNYEVPNIPETYVHRIGRTGRAGKEGIAISFCDTTERPFIRDIHKLIGKNIPIVDNHPYPISDTASFEPEKPKVVGTRQRASFAGNTRSSRPRFR